MIKLPSTLVVFFLTALFTLVVSASSPVVAARAAKQRADAGTAISLAQSATRNHPDFAPKPAQPVSAELPPDSSGLQVTLSAPNVTTSWDERDPDRVRFDLPLLSLHRQREVTPEIERTLEIQITGIAENAEIWIQVVPFHAKTWTGRRPSETRSSVIPDRSCISGTPCTFHWTFDTSALPSDFYYLRVKDIADNTLWENPIPGRPDFVALDTWDVEMASGPVESNASYTVRITYATLFPFARDHRNTGEYLSPDAVTDFIEHQFVSIVQDTWHTQLREWGFGAPIHPDWDADKTVEIIITAPPFALLDGTGTYTVFHDAVGRPYPERRIWWLSSTDSFLAYDSLENGYRTVFAHEFFHLMQWNVLLNSGQATDFWQYAFIEGQGMFIPSVQFPELALSREYLVQDEDAGQYVKEAANGYLTRRLNRSFATLETDTEHRYDAALYWRFLYEQYGDMAVIRTALEEMVRHLEIAEHYSADIVKGMAPVMNATFARLDGPFHSFEESLAAFAQANYALRLENGRCAAPNLSACGGRYFDPEHMYGQPALETYIQYDGFERAYMGSVPASYGVDVLEVGLEATLQGQPLSIRFHSEGDVARFNLQVWKLTWGEARPRAVAPQPEMVDQAQDGTYIYHIPRLDTTSYNRFALIITRIDPGEAADPEGKYEVTLDSETVTDAKTTRQEPLLH